MHKIAVIPGDGIGPEVVAQGLKILEYFNEDFQLEEFNIGAERYLADGEIIPEGILKKLETFDAIYLGAVGDPRVPAGVLEKGILLKLRFYFDQYVNLRPVKLMKEEYTPLKDKGIEDIDFTVVRENTEGLYAGLGGFFKKGTADEIATQEMIASRKGVDRIIDYAFNFAQKSGDNSKVTLCDKSNVLTYAHDLWQRTFSEKCKQYSQVAVDHCYVDALTMKMVRKPEDFDVIVTCNLFGDIVTDLGAELQGGMGLSASANINPEGVSMFEPVHGSAPDIAGENKANPLAAILAAAMMLEHFDMNTQAKVVEDAVKQALDENNITVDMGGHLTTEELGDYILKLIKKEGGNDD